MGAYNATGDAISGGNETAAVGGDVVAMDTGDGNANGGNGIVGAANANGGTAISGDAKVVNSVYVSQHSDQQMKVWDNDSWSFKTFEKKHRWPI